MREAGEKEETAAIAEARKGMDASQVRVLKGGCAKPD